MKGRRKRQRPEHAAPALAVAKLKGEGGLAVTLAECCLAGAVGLEPAAALAFGERLDAALFGEAQSRFVVAVADDEGAATLTAMAHNAGVTVTLLGHAGGERFRVGPLDAPLELLRDAHEGGLERALQG